ncbi:TolC family protein [bacterium]|nr:TolC family protein [bacterium]
MVFSSWIAMLFLFLPCVTLAAVKDLPEEAQMYLNEIPNKQLTLEFVVARALSSADSFQVPVYETLRAESAYYSVVSFEDLKLKASYAYTNNQNEVFPIFLPNSSKGWQAMVGVEQYLSSGTAVSLEGTHSPRQSGFASGVKGDVIESRMTVGLQQSLLGDFFGSAYRATKRSAEASKKALLLGAQTQLETTTLDLIGLYYQAWLKKELTLNWYETQKRKEKLARILQAQLKRGVVETSDVLQIENAASQANLEYIKTKRDLQNLWEQLVVNLKLPRSFLQVKAEEIPLVLDSPEAKSSELCSRMSFTDLEKNSSTIQQSNELVTAAFDKYKAQKQKLWPDLKFVGNYSVNSIEADGTLSQPSTSSQAQASRTFDEVGRLDHPSWTAGVQLSFPLQNRALKAQYLTAKADFEQARLRRSIVLGDLENKWNQTCTQLKIKKETRDTYKEISQKNKRRVEIDNRRFQVGRIKAFQWVQTEDDEANSSLLYKQAEVEVRQIAWDIQRQTGHMVDLLQKNLPQRMAE